VLYVVTQRPVEVELVGVPTPFALSREVAFFFEIGNDPLDRALRDADAQRNIPEC
jgi:hypothetical protein